MELRIAHLSDIHFRYDPERIGHDSNESMREDVIEDLEKLVKEFGPLHAVVVSGDIAFSGKPDEFKLAREWFYRLLDRTNSTGAKIIVCPGNHDIDRGVFSNNQSILDSHEAIRASSDCEKIEKELFARLSRAADRDLLMKSLENYNNFAVEYKCDFTPNQARYSWHHDLELNDGSILRFRGLNTTILCGKKDFEGSLFLGRSAWSIKKDAGVEYVAFAHHPPSWLIDKKEMENELDDRARIQLYGHEHSAKIAPGVNSVKLFAGAVNPERDYAEWKPGYNFLRISVNGLNNQRELVVIVHSREWQQTSPSQFKEYRGREADGTHKYMFELRPWTRRPEQVPISSSMASAPQLTGLASSLGAATPISTGDHEFLRRFFDLTFAQQKKIFDELDLLDPKEAKSAQFVQVRNGLVRARERDLLGAIAKKL